MTPSEGLCPKRRIEALLAGLSCARHVVGPTRHARKPEAPRGNFSGLLRAASCRRRASRARLAGSAAANSPARRVAREFITNDEPVGGLTIRSYYASNGAKIRLWQHVARGTTTINLGSALARGGNTLRVCRPTESAASSRWPDLAVDMWGKKNMTSTDINNRAHRQRLAAKENYCSL